jgi:hypothetical protein
LHHLLKRYSVYFYLPSPQEKNKNLRIKVVILDTNSFERFG